MIHSRKRLLQDFMSSDPFVKVEKLSALSARTMETKSKSPEPKKMNITLKMGQEVFEGLNPFDVKQKVVMLVHHILFFLSGFE